MYDYSQDCPVKDPFLADHLAHWGIDIMKQEKTVKTTAELNIELNMNYDWSAIVGDDGVTAFLELFGSSGTLSSKVFEI